MRIRTGDPAGLAFYQQHDRIHAGEPDELTDRVYAAWQTDITAGRVAVMIAADRDTVQRLNDRARLDRIITGHVTPTGMPLRNGSTAGRGDVIVTRHNRVDLHPPHAPDTWVRNGDLWTVEHVHADGSMTVHSREHDGRVRLPADYVTEHVELGYASTIYRAQGITVDIAHGIVTPAMTRQQLYVMLTRGRNGNHLYLPDHYLLDVDMAQAPRQGADPHDLLAAITRRDGAEHSATETMRDELERPDRIDTMAAAYTHAVSLLAPALDTAEILTRALSADLARAVLEDPAFPALPTTLRRAGLHGDDPATLLTAAAADRELATARSAAQVLHWRIEARNPPDPDAPLPWLDPPRLVDPFVRTEQQRDLADWLHHQAAAIRDRVTHLGTTLADTPVPDRPVWAAGLGPAPLQQDARRDWTHAAGTVAAHREQHDITHPTAPLGDLPAGRHRGSNAATVAYHHARQLSENAPPEQLRPAAVPPDLWPAARPTRRPRHERPTSPSQRPGPAASRRR